MDKDRTRALVVRGLVRLAVLCEAPDAARASEETIVEWFGRSDQVGSYLRESETSLPALVAEFAARMRVPSRRPPDV
jgi:hypothetical protein